MTFGHLQVFLGHDTNFYADSQGTQNVSPCLNTQS